MNRESFQWRVYIELKVSFNPVSMLFYASTDYSDAFEYLDTRRHLVTKKRKVYVKQLGSKHRHFYFDARFAEALRVQEVEADEWYEEDTADDKAVVNIHSKYKLAQWRGIRRL